VCWLFRCFVVSFSRLSRTHAAAIHTHTNTHTRSLALVHSLSLLPEICSARSLGYVCRHQEEEKEVEAI